MRKVCRAALLYAIALAAGVGLLANGPGEAGWEPEDMVPELTSPPVWLSSEEVVCSTSGGLLRTTPDGQQWRLSLQDTPTPGYAVLPSPDGQSIAYISGEPGAMRVLVVNSTDGTRRASFSASPPGAFWGVWGAWAREGEVLCYVGLLDAPTAQQPRSSLLLADLRTGTDRTLTEPGAYSDNCPSFLGTSSRVAFSRMHHRDTEAGEVALSQVCVVETETGECELLTDGHVDRRPLASPSGRYVAFLRLDSYIGTTWWVMDTDSGKAWPVVGDLAFPVSYHAPCQWIKDERSLFLVSRGVAYLATVADGSLARVQLSERVTGAAALALDEQWVAFEAVERTLIEPFTRP